MMKKEKGIIYFILSASLILMQNVSIPVAKAMDVDYLINESLEHLKHVSDYTCTLEKKVNKDGVVYYDPEIRVKYKKPAHYYFKWVKGKFEGQEVIYREGSNRNKIVAHSGGFFRFITLYLDPEGNMAMKRNHHSLRRSGMEKIFDIFNESYSRYKLTGFGNIALAEEGAVDNRPVWIVYGEFPENMDFYAAKIILCIDREYLLPLKVSVYDWSDTLYEEYTFHDLKINVGLNEDDFDPENSEYNFK